MSCEERKARMARNGDVISGIYEAVGSEFIWSHQEMPEKCGCTCQLNVEMHGCASKVGGAPSGDYLPYRRSLQKLTRVPIRQSGPFEQSRGRFGCDRYVESGR